MESPGFGRIGAFGGCTAPSRENGARAAGGRVIARDSLFELARALGGLPVLGCLRGTPAALAGVRYGDILLSVNGRPTRTFGDYLEAKALRSDGMSIVVFRSGEERPIAFEYDANRGTVDPVSVLAELLEMRVLPGDIGGSGPTS